jgi:transcriptional regulator GlxA family with amidase domain
MAKTAIATVGVFAYRGCSAWITAGLIELFAIANVAITQLKRPAPRARFDCRTVGRSRQMVAGSHGVRFAMHRRRRRYHGIIVPPLWCTSLSDLDRRRPRLASEVAVLRKLASRSHIVASACSGSVLLADAGLLANRRATTCWWLAEWFHREFPDTDLVPHQLVAIDGDRWTAAAGSAYIHLGLEFVRRFAGDEAAALTARLMLVERRRGSQSPFVDVASAPSDCGDADVARAARYFDEQVATPVTIVRACRDLAISPRTLTRRFQANLGMSPITYLQSRRVARAKRMLEDHHLAFERIVEQCGYEDVSSFRKLFARHVGMTPREYRSRFGVEK